MTEPVSRKRCVEVSCKVRDGDNLPGLCNANGHTCNDCKQPMHGICGFVVPGAAEGYRGVRRCSLCASKKGCREFGGLASESHGSGAGGSGEEMDDTGGSSVSRHSGIAPHRGDEDEVTEVVSGRDSAVVNGGLGVTEDRSVRKRRALSSLGAGGKKKMKTDVVRDHLDVSGGSTGGDKMRLKCCPAKLLTFNVTRARTHMLGCFTFKRKYGPAHEACIQVQLPMKDPSSRGRGSIQKCVIG